MLVLGKTALCEKRILCQRNSCASFNNLRNEHRAMGGLRCKTCGLLLSRLLLERSTIIVGSLGN